MLDGRLSTKQNRRIRKLGKKVLVLIGAGSIGVAIARRICSAKHIVIADLSLENAGFEVTVTQEDISSNESILNVIALSKSLGDIVNFINAAGVSPSQAPITKILEADLYGHPVIYGMKKVLQSLLMTTLKTTILFDQFI